MDYPRDYIIPNQDINSGTAFVVMPINAKFDLPLGVIIEVCHELGINAQRADDISRQDFVMSNILEGIAKSELVIVDITGNNPNVFYELGIAHSLRARQSIIIISQDEDLSKSPFDVRHMSIMKYDIKNIHLFKSSLREKMNSCKTFVDCEEYIYRLLKSYAFDGTKIHNAISYAKQLNEENLKLICDILNESVNPVLCDEIKLVEIYQYLTKIGEHQNEIYKKIAWTLKSLVFASDYVLVNKTNIIEYKFLQNWQKEDTINMGDVDYWDFVANICMRIIEHKYSLKDVAIRWMTSYLKNIRMGRIDRVRGKIEDFLMTIPDKDVDNAIVQLILGDSLTARESAIDICGQKPIMESADILQQLINKNESSPYIVRSSINALTRMRITSAGPAILKWMENNRDKWGQQAVSASLRKVAEEALAQLDKESYIQLVNLE